MSEAAKEGFLCPICYRDLGNISELQSHFDEVHEEEKDILQSFKEIFGKAKKVLKIESSTDQSSLRPRYEKEKSIYKGTNLNEKLSYDYEIQPLGQVTNHIQSFKKMRATRFDRYIEESNKLILKIDALINNDNFKDLNLRKNFEKSIVDWVPDHLVSLCPYCHKSFQLTHRRKHHCRLCGAVLCHKCSIFISYHKAQALISPKLIIEENDNINHVMSPPNQIDRIPTSTFTQTTPLNQLTMVTTEKIVVDREISTNQLSSSIMNSNEPIAIQHFPSHTTTDHHKRSSSIQLNQPITIEHLVADRDHATSNGFINSSRLAILTKLKRSDSISSINSYNSYFPSPAIIGQFHFRACLDCSYLVDKRLQLIKSNIPISTEEQSAGQAKVAHFLTTYQEMHRCIIEVRKLLPSYSAKVDSLSTYGKSIQQYNQARRMREEIMRNGEKIEHLSRSLQILTGVMDPEAEINLNLVKAIRSMSCKFLKDNFLTLPKLPDQASFDETLLSDKCHVVPIQPLPLKVPDDNEKTTPAHQSQSLKIDQSHLSKHGTSTKELANTKNERVIELVSWPVSPALSKNIGLEEKDVLREQIEIITGYLETALKTDDLDQVYTLETNLKELKDILDAS